MFATEIKIHGRYGMRTSKSTTPVVHVRILATHPMGGWLATNLDTRRTIRIRSAKQLVYDLDVVETQQAAHDRARELIARLIEEQRSK